MAQISNVELSNTFDTWRLRTNALFSRINQFAINESALYANNITANSNFIATSARLQGNTRFTGALDANANIIILDADGDTTMGSPSDDRIRFTFGGTDRLVINNANVGFNTTAPAAGIHSIVTHADAAVIHESTLSTAESAPDFILYRNSGAPAGADYLGDIVFRGKSNALGDVDYATIKTQIVDHSSGSEDGRISLNLMKAGTASDIATFDYLGLTVDGSVRINGPGALKFGANVAFTQISANTLAISTGGVNSLVINGSKKIGLGTDAPLHKLDVRGGSVRLENDYKTTWGGDTNYITGHHASDKVEIFAGGLVRISALDHSIKMSSNTVPSTDSTYNLGASGREWLNVFSDNLYGTIQTAAQPNITSIGDLTDVVCESITCSGPGTMTIANTFVSTSSISFYSAYGRQYTITTSGSVQMDMNNYQNFHFTLNGNLTLANPSMHNIGQSGFIIATQDGTGSRTLALGTDFETEGGNGITLTTTASVTDVLSYYVLSSTRIMLAPVVKAYS